MKKSLLPPWLQLLDNLFDRDTLYICEIGTHRGKTAEQLCLHIINNFQGKFKYVGYDAFELATEDSDNDEINGKGPGDYRYANHLLRRVANLSVNVDKKFTYKLIEGWTENTLKENTFDLVYVDGGHSYETVKHDHQKIKDSKVVVFDDYQIPDVKKYVDEFIAEENIKEVPWDFDIINNATETVYAFMPHKQKQKKAFKERGLKVDHIQPVFFRR